MKRKLWVIYSAISYNSFSSRTEAIMVMPFNMEELAKRAEKVFVGTCMRYHIK